MRYSLIAASFASVLLMTTSACTQAAAPVELKGQNNYTRSGMTALSTPASVNTATLNMATSQSAAVASIGVSDLSAPSGSKVGGNKAASNNVVSSSHTASAPASGTSNNPFKYAQKTPVAGATRVNPWTNHARATDGASGTTQQAANSDAATGALDHIVDNDSSYQRPADVRPATVHLTKPAKSQQASAARAFMWPVASQKVISQFGPKGGGKVNDGINIASGVGEPVWAAADGEVVYVGNELQGYGNMVLIKHTGAKATTYAHLSKATVDKYEHVKQGDIIGYVGTSGNVKEPQLHFAIRDGKDAVDPTKYLGRNVASLQ